MKTNGQNLAVQTAYTVCQPSLAARDHLLYPVYAGHSLYPPAYSMQGSEEDCLILEVCGGLMEITYDSFSYLLTPGHLLLLPPQKKYGFTFPMGGEAYWCRFNGTEAAFLAAQITDAAGIVHEASGALSIKQLYETLTAAPFASFMQEHMYHTLLHRIFDAAARSGKSSCLSPELAPILTYLQEHFAESVSDEELALMRGLSKFHFIRSFKKETGYTPHEYLVHIRIAHAKYFLRFTNLSTKEVAAKTGFSGESVFCSAFKKHTGQSPLVYRETY